MAKGLELIKEHYNSDYRIRTVSVRILEKHAKHVELLAAALSKKAVGLDDEAMKLYEKYRIESGKDEIELGLYFDHTLYNNHLPGIFKKKSEFAGGPIIESV